MNKTSDGSRDLAKRPESIRVRDYCSWGSYWVRTEGCNGSRDSRALLRQKSTAHQLHHEALDRHGRWCLGISTSFRNCKQEEQRSCFSDNLTGHSGGIGIAWSRGWSVLVSFRGTGLIKHEGFQRPHWYTRYECFLASALGQKRPVHQRASAHYWRNTETRIPKRYFCSVFTSPEL